MADVDVDPAFWRGRRVLVTGHTGFKGGWLALWLASMGAEVTGLSDGVPSTPSLFELARVGDDVHDVRADVRDADTVRRALRDARPEVVFHLAAQPLVRASLSAPRETWEVNVIGTLNVLEAVRAVRRRARRGQRDLGQVLREPRVGVGLPRGRADGRPRPLLELQGRGRARHGGLAAHVLLRSGRSAARPPPGPATRSAAATGAPIA